MCGQAIDGDGGAGVKRRRRRPKRKRLNNIRNCRSGDCQWEEAQYRVK